MTALANPRENIQVNLAYEDIAAAVATLGAVTDNGPTPTLGEVRARTTATVPSDKDRWRRDDSTGFDDPIVCQIGGYNNFRRTSAYGFRVIYSAEKKPSDKAETIQIDVDGHGTGSTAIIWMDDFYWANWFKYQQEAWTNARLIDARHLTPDEAVTLKVLVDYVTQAMCASTRATPIIRGTLDQCFQMIHDDTHPQENVPGSPGFHMNGYRTYLPQNVKAIPDGLNDPENQPVARYRKMMRPEFITHSERLLQVLAPLKFDFRLATKMRYG